MKNFRITFFFLAVALTLSGCGLFGGSDSTDVTVAEDVAAQPTVNSVQAVPAETADSTADGAQAEEGDAATAALPTAVTLPTAAPTPEPTVDRSQPTSYIVKSGDVLGLIAESFDADIAELRRVNDLDGNLIRVGQTLIIPALEGSTPTETDATSDDDGSETADGDLIKSGEVLNTPGGSTPSPTSVPGTPAGTAVPAATVGPINDADCKARNADFPYYHASDGLCYANPIGGTPVPTSTGADPDATCEPGRFLWDDGLCYPIPGVTVTPTAGPSPTAGALPNYGTVPCRDGYLPLEGGRCWPEPETTPATVVPVAAATATASAANTVACEGPNFTLGGTGTCFLLQAGVDAGCTIEGTAPNQVPKCPAA